MPTSDQPTWWVRAARTEDAAAVGQVHAAAQRSAFRGLVPEAVLATVTADLCAQAWTAAFDQHDNRWIDRVVESDDGIVAIASAGPVGVGVSRSHASYELYAVYVSIGSQRRGLGSLLLREVVTGLWKREIGSMQAVCLRDSPARGFYEAIGARLVDEGEHEPSPGVHVPHLVYLIDLSQVRLSAPSPRSRGSCG